VLALDTIIVSLALFLAETPDYFFHEGRFITYISMLQLLIVSGLAWKIFLTRRGDLRGKLHKRPFFIWLIIAIAFFCLSMDDALQIHEYTDTFVHNIFNIEESALTDRLDDIMVGFYGLVGLFALFSYREELKKYKKALPYLFVGYSFVFLMIIFDVLTNRNDILPLVIADTNTCVAVFRWVDALEDIFKIFAGGLFIVAAYQCLKVSRKFRISN